MNKKTALVLKRISDRIPKALMDHLLKEEVIASETLRILPLIIADPETPPKLRERLETIRDSKILEQKEWVVDAEIEKQIDEWYQEEIQKAIKVGLLPKPKRKEILEVYKNKGKQYARKSNRRTKRVNLEGGGEAVNPAPVLQESLEG